MVKLLEELCNLDPEHFYYLSLDSVDDALVTWKPHNVTWYASQEVPGQVLWWMLMKLLYAADISCLRRNSLWGYHYRLWPKGDISQMDSHEATPVETVIAAYIKWKKADKKV